MACDVMAVRLHLPQVRVLEVLEDAPGALRVSVESTFRRLRCPQCGFRCHRVGDRRDKKVRDLEVSGRRTVLVWSRRKMVCDNCDSRFLEDHPALEGALARRLARRLVADAKVMTFNAVARRRGVHSHAVRAVVDVWSALVAERRRSRRCSVLLVDETSMRKRHRYVTVIVNGDTGRTLAMVEHRSSAALSAFLMTCSRPGSRCCAEATPSPTPTAPASMSCSTPTPASEPAGRQALQELHGLYTADDHDGAPEALGRFYRPLRDRRTARVPQHRRHAHRMVRRDPQPAPHRPGPQRHNRGN